jgi:hypothetical protein
MADRLVALAGCADGVYRLEVGEDADDDDVLDHDPDAAVERDRPLQLAPAFAAARVLDVDARGSTIVVLLERRPPLLVSYDGGTTWGERGAGLPPGRAVAVGDTPDLVLYAAASRLYVSRDGGRFWRSLGIELPEIVDVAWESD